MVNKEDFIGSYRRVYQEDQLSGSVQVINFEHHEIHEGDRYFIENYADLPINNVLDIQIVTPNSMKQPHFEAFFTCESGFNIWLYEGVTISTAGTLAEAINRNRRSGNTADVVVRTILNTSVANANADTAIAGAKALRTIKVGSSVREPGESIARNEIILKRNTAYSLRFEAVAAGYVTYLIDWYEHESAEYS